MPDLKSPQGSDGRVHRARKTSVVQRAAMRANAALSAENASDRRRSSCRSPRVSISGASDGNVWGSEQIRVVFALLLSICDVAPFRVPHQRPHKFPEYRPTFGRTQTKDYRTRPHVVAQKCRNPSGAQGCPPPGHVLDRPRRRDCPRSRRARAAPGKIEQNTLTSRQRPQISAQTC